jgi:hypothetical protein
MATALKISREHLNHNALPPARGTDHEPRFVPLISGREPTPNLWIDAWLAVLALSLDYEMTTFDRRFKSFRGLKLRLLTAL